MNVKLARPTRIVKFILSKNSRKYGEGILTTHLIKLRLVQLITLPRITLQLLSIQLPFRQEADLHHTVSPPIPPSLINSMSREHTM
jgi:hypothetical protein